MGPLTCRNQRDTCRRIHSPFTHTLEGSTLRISVHERFNIWGDKKGEKKKLNRYIIAWGPENKYIKPWPLSALSSLENRLGRNT